MTSNDLISIVVFIVIIAIIVAMHDEWRNR